MVTEFSETFFDDIPITFIQYGYKQPTFIDYIEDMRN
jgi:hypothetical protein